VTLQIHNEREIFEAGLPLCKPKFQLNAFDAFTDNQQRLDVGATLLSIRVPLPWNQYQLSQSSISFPFQGFVSALCGTPRKGYFQM
jgi:hypothetical protein